MERDSHLQVKLAEIGELADLCRYLDELVPAQCQNAQVHQVPNVGRQNLEIVITAKKGKNMLTSLHSNHLRASDCCLTRSN